jgi:hypothetical protein
VTKSDKPDCDCPYESTIDQIASDVKDIRRALFQGNGKPGMLTRIEVLEQAKVTPVVRPADSAPSKESVSDRVFITLVVAATTALVNLAYGIMTHQIHLP